MQETHLPSTHSLTAAPAYPPPPTPQPAGPANFIQLRPEDMNPMEAYTLLIGSVVPRPIAVVSTMSPAGLTNVAPFSFFMAVGCAPLTLAFSIAGPKITTGKEKDTLRNARPEDQGGLGEFVIHIAAESYVQEINKAATPFADDVSEFDMTALTPVPSVKVRPPRVAEAPMAFECKTSQIIEAGAARLIIGEVVHITMREDLMDERGLIDPGRLSAIGRMAGSWYCTTRDLFWIQDQAFFPPDGNMGT